MAYKAVFLLFLYKIENTRPMCTNIAVFEMLFWYKQHYAVYKNNNTYKYTNGRYSTLGNKNFKEFFFSFYQSSKPFFRNIHTNAAFGR